MQCLKYTLDFFRNRSKRSSVGSDRNAETGVYTEVNEDFEYRTDLTDDGVVGSERSLLTSIKVITIALLGSASFVFAHDNDLDIRLKSYSEVPSVSSTATGKFKASAHRKSNSISYELSYKDLQGDVRQAHIHFGQTGVNGGIMVWLCQTSTSPDPTGLAPVCPQSGTVSGTLQAANIVGPAGQGIDPMEFAEFLDAIRAGAAYVNVHSSKFPSGEIRGQFRNDD